MEAQVENATQAQPQSIVEQLLEIAKKYDAMDVIGGSTSWRWQEGLITRMPKTKTVAAILTKAFNSDDPNVWIRKTDRELRSYLLSVYSVSDLNTVLLSNIKDKYELLFIYSTSDSRGATFEELKFKLCLFKYAEVFANEILYFEDLDEDLVLNINGDWADLRIQEMLEKYSPSQTDDGRFTIGCGNCFGSGEETTKFIRELEILRLRIVGYNSHFDMWRFYGSSLTDREMVYIERNMLAYYEKLINEIQNVSFEFDKEEELTRKTRVFSLSSFSIPNSPKESLTCKY